MLAKWTHKHKTIFLEILRDWMRHLFKKYLTQSQRISRAYTMKHAPLRASKQEFYWPISFSVNLLEFDTFVYNSIFAFGCLVTRNRNPYLIVNHPHQKEREYEKVDKVCFAFSLDYHWVCAMSHPWDQNHILSNQKPKRKLKY